MSNNINPSRFFSRLSRTLLSRQAVTIYWIVNLTLFIGLLMWVGMDGKFSQAARLLSHVAPWDKSDLQIVTLPPMLSTRVYLLNALVIAGFISAVGIVCALFFGAGSTRSLRAWLAVMFVMAAWLTFYTTWPDYAWRAQAWRVSRSLPALELLARTLLDDWPSQDGQHPAIGPFNAYPIGSPRTLMLLTKPHLSGSNLRISTIERGDGRDLYFQLTGSDEGATLARITGRNQPHAYYSGLEGGYQPFRSHALGKNWFLVQYLYAPIVDGGGASSAR